MIDVLSSKPMAQTAEMLVDDRGSSMKMFSVERAAPNKISRRISWWDEILGSIHKIIRLLTSYHNLSPINQPISDLSLSI